MQSGDMTHTNEALSPRPRRNFTVRAFVLGGLVCVLIGVGGPYGKLVMQASALYTDFSTAGAHFLLFMTVLLFNVGLKRLWPGAELSRGELTTVAVMAIMGSSLTTMGLTAYLLPNITAPYYYATPENHWAEHLHPHLERSGWLVPVDWSASGPARVEAIRQFYEGLPRQPGESVLSWLGRIPWGVWARPLAMWGILLGGLYAIMTSLMVILRRQWMEHERLIYPIAQVPAALIDSGDPGRRDKPLWARGALWIGFAIPFTMGMWSALARYMPGFPRPIELIARAPLFQSGVGVQLRVSFPTIGFAFLINRDVALSIWLLNLVSVLTRGLFDQFGIVLNQNLGCYGTWQKPILAHQGMGAMLVLALGGFWVARRHLADVLRKAFTRARDVDDSDEILSYRAAVWLFLAGVIVMVTWISFSGLAWWISVYFVLSAILIFVGLTRIVVEGGTAVTIAPMIAPTFVMTSLGTRAMGPAGVCALVMSWVWMSDIRTFVMASAAHGLKLTHGIRGRRRPMFWAIVLAIVLTLIASIVTLMIICYAIGGVNLGTWFFMNGPKYPFNYGTSHIKNPLGPNIQGWMWTGVGAAVMIGLMVARRFLGWWPLHPVGFPISAVNWTDYLWLSIMIAWLIKSIVIRYGGPKLYRRVRPAFLGLILGQLSVSGLWFIIDLLTGMTGNRLFTI